MKRHLFLALAVFTQISRAQPFLGNGIKVGEVQQSSAVIWVRLTAVKRGNPSSIEDAAPGASGQVFLTYSRKAVDEPVISKGPFSVDASADYTVQISLDNLSPGQDYAFTVHAHNTDGNRTDSLRGVFRTAYAAENTTDVRLAVVTCQGIGTVDDEEHGHRAYRDILPHRPDFFVHTGDIVYYDKAYGGRHPISTTVKAARQRWNRMFAYTWNQEFHRQVSSYFMKDDHDTLMNDCWPGQTYGDLTFAQGLQLFREQTPASALPYRTVRWGKHLQIWLLEGRDYRSPNRSQDGPDKTVLGAEQKAWLTQTVSDSTATFKLVISPSPIVGPDKKGKADNLANAVYQTEGDEIRRFLASIDNLVVVCGDRHWQYASKDSETGLMEFGCGPINNVHAQIGGNPGRQAEHLFFGGVRGGYLLIDIRERDGAVSLEARWMGLTSVSQPDRNVENYRLQIDANTVKIR